MNVTRRSIALATGLAIMLTSVAAPASAVGERITFVNGIPGKRVDVCINGKEIRSGLRYGKKTNKVFGSAGTKKLKVFVRHPGTCKGTRLIRRNIPLDLGGDLTLVFTKKSPRLVAFDNSDLGFIGPAADDFAAAWRHAADIEGLTFKQLLAQLPPITPAVDPVWTKGDESTLIAPLAVPIPMFLSITKADSFEPFIAPFARTIRPNRRHQYILLGTKRKNARLLTIVQRVDGFSS